MKKFKNLPKKCEQCTRNTLLPIENQFTCIPCGYNVKKQQNNISKNSRIKKIINGIKCSQSKKFCICIDVYKIYEDDDFNEIYEVLSSLKSGKLKFKNEKIEKYKNMDPDFEQNYFSLTAQSLCRVGYDSIQLMKWMA